MKTLEDVEVEVIGRREQTKGFLFRRQYYYVSLKIIDKRVTKARPVEIRVPYHKYVDLNTGKKILVNMYSNNGERWRMETDKQ